MLLTVILIYVTVLFALLFWQASHMGGAHPIEQLFAFIAGLFWPILVPLIVIGLALEEPDKR